MVEFHDKPVDKQDIHCQNQGPLEDNQGVGLYA